MDEVREMLGTALSLKKKKGGGRGESKYSCPIHRLQIIIYNCFLK